MAKPKKPKAGARTATLQVDGQDVDLLFQWPSGRQMLDAADKAKDGDEAGALRIILSCIDELAVNGDFYADPLDAPANILREVVAYLFGGGLGKGGGSASQVSRR